MAAQFTELDTPKGQGKLNGFLSDKSYVSGFEPSNEDLELLKKFSEAPPAKFAHLRRWFDHIQSFSEEERAAFAPARLPRRRPPPPPLPRAVTTTTTSTSSAPTTRTTRSTWPRSRGGLRSSSPPRLPRAR